MTDADKLLVSLQLATEPVTELPDESRLQAWAMAAINAAEHNDAVTGCITVRMVGIEESQQLNALYRQKDYATNVLAFPAAPVAVPDLPAEDIEVGDLVICQDVVLREATEQNKPPLAHFAHMVVHGTLHLIGYDHQTDAEAAAMEGLESAVMQAQGFADPYLSSAD